ncbi:hypothetical protein [uncultured Lacinutrix sp.]|uniref:hypothetical protein n=1 Tax=uncultured Lacinutrix sp. TaxID=574032 RepID=UPI002615A849|nr:hypothetical protein [uncultured Lacinutrix sp.]
MKENIKFYLKLGALFCGILLFFNSCQNDDDKFIEDNNIINDNNYTVQVIPESDYNKNLDLSKHLKRFNKAKSNSQNRDVYNSEYDFTVDTDFAKYVESIDGNTHSYTFPVIGTVDDDTAENLVFTLQPDGSYNTEIVEYRFTGDNDMEIRKASLSIDASDYLSRGTFSYQCTTTVTYHIEWNFNVGDCPDGPCQELVIDNVTTSCTYQYNFISASPTGGGTGGWTNGTVITTGGGGSGGTTTSSPQTTTSTVTSPFIDKAVIKRRQKLQEISDNPVIKNKIGELVLGINSVQSNNYQEDGARFKLIGENEYQNPPREPNERLNNGVNYTPDYLDNEIVSVHIHQQLFYDLETSDQPYKNSPVFSDGDIKEFLGNIKFIENSNSDLTEDVTSILLSEIGAFALVVEDKQLAIDANNALQNAETKTKFELDFEKKVLKEWRNNNCDNACLIKKINKFIKKYKINGQKLGISIYQASIFENQIVFWNKL